MYHKLKNFAGSDISKKLFLIIFAVGLIGFRMRMQTFGVSIGYLYVFFISLSGFWFGITGGLTAGIFACGIFVLEINMFTKWEARALAINGVHLRFAIYLISGAAFGYMSMTQKQLRARLEKLVSTDELTNCWNYRYIINRLQEETERARRYGKMFSVAMLDIDYFKAINDTYGHMYGNRVLKIFSQFIKTRIRSMDVLGRYGGDEFLIIFPESDVNKAASVLTRIKNEMKDMDLQAKIPKSFSGQKIRFSAGVCSYPHNAHNINDLISFADNALYGAKSSGRDNILVEKRKFLRVRPSSDLTIEVMNRSDSSIMDVKQIENISQKGMLVVFDKDIPEDEVLCRIKFQGEEKKEKPAFFCKVINKSKGTKDNMVFAGIYFAKIPDNDELKLKKLIQEINRKKTI